ncbi:MAG: enoyl-CoA hydratase/isomerase family protein [Methanomicrobia archaeon]|nr:enoyl-CoA hydratase/isomerase family protein [Methanomicrobia archaeon]
MPPEAEETKAAVLGKRGEVATIILNRPAALNALNDRLLSELELIVQDTAADPAVRVVVITGAGEKAFCAGADLTELSKMTSVAAGALSRRIQRIFNDLEAMRKPIIAQINGFCLAAGLELALACDIRIAAATAVFGLPETTLGLIPGCGGTQRLPRLIGKTKAMELLLTGDRIDAAEAARWGLLNAVVPLNELDRAVDNLLTKLRARSPVALGILKDAVNTGLELDLEQALEYEADCFEAAVRTDDAHEGLAAFVEKRKPKFVGR